ncbi:MAG: hypothetical protein R2735_13225 [Microthrixaceae bacterium]
MAGKSTINTAACAIDETSTLKCVRKSRVARSWWCHEKVVESLATGERSLEVTDPVVLGSGK